MRQNNEMINVTKYMVWWIMNHDVKRECILPAATLAQKMIYDGHRSETIENKFKKLGYLKEPEKSWDIVTRHNFTDPTIRMENKNVFKNAYLYIFTVLVIACGTYLFSSSNINGNWQQAASYNKIFNGVVQWLTK